MQKKALSDYFKRIVYPVLTPMAVDQSRPFPLLHSKEQYLAVILKPEFDKSQKFDARWDYNLSARDRLFARTTIGSVCGYDLPLIVQ